MNVWYGENNLAYFWGNQIQFITGAHKISLTTRLGKKIVSQISVVDEMWNNGTHCWGQVDSTI